MKIGDVVKNKPEAILTYGDINNPKYCISKDRYGYYLFEKVEDGWKYLRSRSNDPLFKECYPELEE